MKNGEVYFITSIIDSNLKDNYGFIVVDDNDYESGNYYLIMYFMKGFGWLNNGIPQKYYTPNGSNILYVEPYNYPEWLKTLLYGVQ